MKKILGNLGFEELPMMTTMMEKYGSIPDDYIGVEIMDNAEYKYRDFITQPLEKWMFVPCNNFGIALEKPTRLLWNSKMPTLDPDDLAVLIKMKEQEYQTALDRVLFEGIWDIEEGKVDHFIFVRCDIEKVTIPIHQYKTIESAINAGVKFKLR